MEMQQTTEEGQTHRRTQSLQILNSDHYHWNISRRVTAIIRHVETGTDPEILSSFYIDVAGKP